MTTQRLMFHYLGTIMTWLGLGKVCETTIDCPYETCYERQCSVCSLTVCQPIHYLQPPDILFCSWRSGLIITYLRTLSLEQKSVIEGIFLKGHFLNDHFSSQETVFRRQFTDTSHCMILCAWGKGFTARPQYQQQQPAANSSTKVIGVQEKGRYCTAAAAYGVVSCHDTVQKCWKYYSIQGKKVLIPQMHGRNDSFLAVELFCSATCRSHIL